MLQSNQYDYCLNVCFKAHDMLQFTSDAFANETVLWLSYFHWITYTSYFVIQQLQ